MRNLNALKPIYKLRSSITLTWCINVFQDVGFTRMDKDKFIKNAKFMLEQDILSLTVPLFEFFFQNVFCGVLWVNLAIRNAQILNQFVWKCKRASMTSHAISIFTCFILETIVQMLDSHAPNYLIFSNRGSTLSLSFNMQCTSGGGSNHSFTRNWF